MKRLLLLAALAALPAHAELYRWVDPQSGSVKFSNLPPPWYGDPEREARSPKVEVISVLPKPAAAPAVPGAVPSTPERAAAQEAAIAAERRREAQKK